MSSRVFNVVKPKYRNKSHINFLYTMSLHCKDLLAD